MFGIVFFKLFLFKAEEGEQRRDRGQEVFGVKILSALAAFGQSAPDVFMA
jgi:hypothetical protein